MIPYLFLIQTVKINIMKNFIKFTAVVLTVFSFAFASCSSTDAIPDDLTARQLIQRGQDSFESKNYKSALQYYDAAVERYGSDASVYVEAKYEMGHIYLKQKKYSYAKGIFDELVDLYSNVLPGQLPGAYYKLAQIGLSKIPEGTVAEKVVLKSEKSGKMTKEEHAAQSIAEPVVEEVSSAAASVETESSSESVESSGSVEVESASVE